MAHQARRAEGVEVLRDRLRVTPVPRLSRVIESGPSADRRPSSRSRMGSPNATNTGTASLAFGAAAPRLGDIRRQVLDLPSPSRVVHAERLGPAGDRNPIEPGLDNREGGAPPALGVLERELDQCHGLG